MVQTVWCSLDRKTAVSRVDAFVLEVFWKRYKKTVLWRANIRNSWCSVDDAQSAWCWTSRGIPGSTGKIILARRIEIGARNVALPPEETRLFETKTSYVRRVETCTRRVRRATDSPARQQIAVFRHRGFRRGLRPPPTAASVSGNRRTVPAVAMTAGKWFLRQLTDDASSLRDPQAPPSRCRRRESLFHEIAAIVNDPSVPWHHLSAGGDRSAPERIMVFRRWPFDDNVTSVDVVFVLSRTTAAYGYLANKTIPCRLFKKRKSYGKHFYKRCTVSKGLRVGDPDVVLQNRYSSVFSRYAECVFKTIRVNGIWIFLSSCKVTEIRKKKK